MGVVIVVFILSYLWYIIRGNRPFWLIPKTIKDLKTLCASREFSCLSCGNDFKREWNHFWSFILWENKDIQDLGEYREFATGTYEAVFIPCPICQEPKSDTVLKPMLLEE